MALFVIDMERTIADGCLYASIFLALEKNPNQKNDVEFQLAQIKNIGVVGDKTKWNNVFDTLLKDGHKVAVVSFSPYVEAIRRYLGDIVGLPKNIMDNIKIISELPLQPSVENKNEIINKAMHETGFADGNNNVILVDNHRKNIAPAMAEKYHIILSDPCSANHIDKILSLSKILSPNAAMNNASSALQANSIWDKDITPARSSEEEPEKKSFWNFF